MSSNKIASSFIWRLAERFGAQGVTFVISIVLARILDPEVYGLLALVTVFTAILQVFVDSGLGTALIQKKDSDDLDFSTVFYFNIAVCLFLYIGLFFFSPGIARFYEIEELTSVIRVLGIILIISGIKNIQQAYVAKHMLFKKFFFSTLGGTIVAAVTGIIMALNGFGIWALVLQFLLNAFVDTVILWITVRWRPKLVFSFERLKTLLSFGTKLLGVSLVKTVYNELRSLIIGKKYTTEDLAFYNKGQQFPGVIGTNIDISIDSVLLPTMVSVQDDNYSVKKIARLSIRIGTFVMMPIMIGLGVCAPSIVRILLTDKWIECVPFMRIACFNLMFLSVFTTNYNCYKALGRSDLYLRVSIISKVIGLIVIFITMRISVMTIAYGLIFSSLFNQLVCAFPTKKLLKYGYFEQIKDFVLNLITAVLMGAVVYSVQFIGLSDWVTLLIQIPVGTLCYILLSKITKNESYSYVVNKLRMVLC